MTNLNHGKEKKEIECLTIFRSFSQDKFKNDDFEKLKKQNKKQKTKRNNRGERKFVVRTKKNTIYMKKVSRLTEKIMYQMDY